ncbi:Ig-like domain-containing protein [Ruminiclostridium sufflavum DSM 19573]|uniref:Ig-like domain-containing protein n=1 Tax=Ruminiclostridium sufflavum DSM 19573 TaxID=1121337 RepID=A0A318Y0G8_9FIRM|nr:Ig-like domain-containing protein [Ruminiclostridium sufflavum]PYG88804.1 Ig-like domain-containing protein [Ruminiclostridium sufflavum DSM 19573]
MLLKLLNHTDIKWNENVFKKAYETGLSADKSYLSKTKDSSGSFTRGQAVLAMNTALSTDILGEDKTLIQTLISEGSVDSETAASLGYDTGKAAEAAVIAKIQGILAVSGTEITIDLNTEIKAISKNNVLIYEAGNKNNTLDISSVTPSGTKLKITTGNQVPGKSYTVELINIKDSEGNILTGLTGSFTGYAQIIMPPAGSASSSSPSKASLSVDSITAINAKQIQIVFNKEMEESSVTDISFYEIKDNGTEAISLAQGAVNYNNLTKTAIITLNNKISDRLTNLTTAKVTVKKGIKASDGSELENDINLEVKVEDLGITTLKNIEAVGEKAIKITLSEPVYDSTNNNILDVKNFSVELLKPKYTEIEESKGIAFSHAYTYTIQRAELLGSTIILTLTESISEGILIVHINSSETETPIQDYANNILSHRRFMFTYTKTGKTSSQVTVKKVKDNAITLGFSKPVTAKDLKLFHTDKNVVANMSTPVSIDEGAFVNEITFEFPDRMPIGTTDLFLVNSTDPSCKMFNIYGQYVPDQTIVAEVGPDKTAPHVTSTELNGNFSFKIYFNEVINRTVALDSASYSFTTAEEKSHISFTPMLSSDQKSVTLNLPKPLRDNTDYKVVVKNAEDLYGNKIASDIPFTFTNGEYTTPSLEEGKCFTLNSEGKIIIYFSEPMNEAQMLDKANYMVATTQGAIYSPLGTEDTVSKLSDRSVMLKMSTEVNLPNVKMSSITDLSGKILNSPYPAYLNAIDKERVMVKSADLIAKNKVKITFNSKLYNFSNNDISFTGVTEGAIRTAYVESMIVNGDDNTEVALVLDKDLSTDVKYNGFAISSLTRNNCYSKSVFGTGLSPLQSISIMDKVAPEVITFDHDSSDLTEPVEKVVLSGDILSAIVDGKVPKGTTGKITIYYSEPIASYSISLLTFAVEGYTVTAISNTVNNSEVVLSVKADSDNTPARTTVRQVYEIYDYSVNYFLPDKAWKVR